VSALFENTVPLVPSAQVLGMLPTFAAYWVQSGIGDAPPRQVSDCSPDGKPVLSMAPCTSVRPGVFWKTPKPPRSTARGARTMPGISVS
jgi:hypothetical protein